MSGTRDVSRVQRGFDVALVLCVALTARPAAADGNRFAHVVTLKEVSAGALQKALDGLDGPAVVVLPAGRFVIDQAIEVKSDDLLLVGAGAGRPAFGSSADASTTVFARDGDQPSAHLAALVHNRGHARFQLSGIRFEGVAAPTSTSKDIGVLLEDAADFRVDHSYFTHLGFAGVRANGASYGVVDHSTFFAIFKPAIGSEGYGVVVYGTNALTGLPMGATDDHLGLRNATFIEDCEFSENRHAVSSNKGARYVFRHNHVTNGVIAHAIDVHGTEYASEVGGEWVDAYENRVEQPLHTPPHYDGWAVRIRGGKGVVWNNTFSGYRVGVELTQLTQEVTGPVNIWGNKLVPAGAVAPAPSVMVHADRKNQLGAPHFVEAALGGYRPHPYPHPLVLAGCGSNAPSTAWAKVCGR